jgi:predicted nucleic acid binding AN1-type Zn finger protein
MAVRRTMTSIVVMCLTTKVSDRRRAIASGGEGRSELGANTGRSSEAAVRLDRVVRQDMALATTKGTKATKSGRAIRCLPDIRCAVRLVWSSSARRSRSGCGVARQSPRPDIRAGRCHCHCRTPQVSDRRRQIGSSGERRSELVPSLERSSGAAVRLHRVVRPKCPVCASDWTVVLATSGVPKTAGQRAPQAGTAAA